MTFAQKLDLLLNITNTSNSMLARNIFLDASFISRLRKGVRTPTKNAGYILLMAGYFARRCNAKYQKAALQKVLKSGFKEQLEKSNNMEELLYEWLREGNSARSDLINSFFNDLEHFQFKKTDLLKAVDLQKLYRQALSEVGVYYGNEGKREAVLTFLSLVLQSNNPQTLLLYSDEDMGWLTEDYGFTIKWSNMLTRALENGHKIKIIHTIDRDFDEMLAAIREWVPLYMTGSIEPYYYPRIRDGLFHRTLFIAPDTAAVTSSSIGNNTDKTAKFLFTDKNAITALVAEFNDLLCQCRLLMRVFTPLNSADYLTLLEEFEEVGNDTFAKTDGLTNMTMPITVLESILERMKNPNKEALLAYQKRRINKFLNSLKKHHYTELIPRPDPEKIFAGKVPINFSDMLDNGFLFYTPEEYCQHLQNSIKLLKTYDTYHIYPISQNYLAGSFVYIKEGVGVLLGKTLPPTTVFAINESNMIAAFWDHVNYLIDERRYGKMNREDTIWELETIVTRLKC